MTAIIYSQCVTNKHGGREYSSRWVFAWFNKENKYVSVFGVEPDLTREGGSIPVTLTLQETTGKNTMLLPVGACDDGAHSQNEKIDRRNYIEGVRQDLVVPKWIRNLSVMFLLRSQIKSWNISVQFGHYEVQPKFLAVLNWKKLWKILWSSFCCLFENFIFTEFGEGIGNPGFMLRPCLHRMKVYVKACLHIIFSDSFWLI